jgi:hypothetical protein
MELARTGQDHEAALRESAAADLPAEPGTVGRHDGHPIGPDGTVVIFTAARPPELTDPAFCGQM